MNNYKPMSNSLEEKYVEFVERLGLERKNSSHKNDIHTDEISFLLLHMSMGMVTEAAEILDLLKKNLAYERPINKQKLADELGDLFFYMVGALIDQGLTIEDIINMNMAKLTARYPNGYSHQSANNRNLEAENKAQELIVDDNKVLLK